MAGFVHTLVASVTDVGPITFTAIEDEGATITPGLTEFVFPDTGRVSQVQVVDASDFGPFSFRLSYKGDSGVVKLMDIVSKTAGEVFKKFNVNKPLLEVEGNGVRALRAEALAVGAFDLGCLVIVVVERET